VAAGNQVVIKPSELTPNTSSIMQNNCKHTFHRDHVKVVEGGIEVSNLLAQRWDYIFLLEVLLWAKLLQKLQQSTLLLLH
jgi:aldehyde dehydrogenase (NAD+)